MENDMFSERGNIWKRTLEFVFASGDVAEKTLDIDIDGSFTNMIIVCSGASGAAVTADVTVKNEDGIAIGPSGTTGLAEESETIKDAIAKLLKGITTIGVTPSTDPLSDYTVTVYLMGVIYG